MPKKITAKLSMLANFVSRDLREAYAGTFAGAFWAILQPGFLIGIYWWVFGFIWALKVPLASQTDQEVPFIVFLLSALLPWLAFQDAIGKAVSSVINRADVLRQGHFPVAVFPVARVLGAHTVFCLFVLGFALYWRFPAAWLDVALLLGVIGLYVLQVFFAVGLGLFLSAIAVFVKDLPHLVPMGLMGMFFTAPILFPYSRVPDGLAAWIWLNPYVPFALGNQGLLLNGEWPDFGIWAYCVCLAVGSMVFGTAVFRKLRPGFADVV